ncbi:target of Nesh-SH3 isoform X15 [Latimeria chalumnae]|uniref:target of Nesh-SH3 isoform X15 n=1 Tax=Latimeria chalumnae TaxID=7897 RepID=UPI00313EFBA4
MIPRLVFLFLCGLVLVEVGNAQRFIRVKRQSLKVQINATDDTIILKFVRPSPSTKLEGYILGYGSSLFSKQYIPLPEAGKSYETEVDAEPKYLIAVQPVPTGIFLRKQCTGQLNLPNPLHLVIGTVTPTAVFLTWSISIKPQKEVIITNDCVDDRFYTVRYREKEKNKKWLFKPCPTTETVIDKLKPDTMYEFGVKADKDNGIWSKPISHKTAEPFKDKGNGRIQNTYKPQLPDKMRMLPAKDIKIVLPARPIKPMNTTKHRIILPYRKPELPSKAKAHNQTKQWKPSKPVKSALPDHKLALNKTLLVTAKPTVPHKAEWPNTKPAPNEPQTGASKPITSDRAKLPMAKQAPNEPQIGTPKPITSDSADLPMTKQAPNEPQIGTPKPITSDSADLPMAKKAPIEPQIGTPKPITSQSTDLPMAKQAPIEPQIGTPKPITSQSTDLPMAKQAPIEPQIGTPKPITSQSTDLPMAKQAPIEPQIGTPKPITSQSTDLPMAKQAPIEPQIGTPKPITSQSTDLPMAKQAPIEPQIGTPKPITSQSTDLPMAKQAPIEPQIGTPKPITSQSTDLPMAKQAPIEPQIGTPKPITSDSTDLPMAKQDNRASVSNTVPPLGSSRNTFKKEILRKDQIKAPERSPSAPVKPTVIQRKPWLLINKVDGKPGSKVIIPEPRAPRVTSTTAPVTVSVTTKAPRQKTYPAATVSQEATDTPPDNSSVFNSNPVSDIDPMGKQRYTAPSRTTSSTSPFEGTSSDHRLRSPSGPHDDDEEEETPTLQYDVPRASTTQVSAASCIPVRQAETAPHVLYMKKKPDIPCSITDSLSHFPTDEANNQNITSPPQYPPSNLTVVTVEGCPSFVILDWEKVENDTATEYEVISKEKGSPTGEDESILTTNQTHSAVENLKPDTSYEFIVKPKNTLGEGPSSNSMSFATESEDPRVTKKSSGKDAIWTAFPFQADEYSQCKGQQFVKRTWYRKFVGVQLCNSLRYKIYLSDSLTGKFYNIGDQTGYGEDHCQFVDSFLDGRTGQQLLPEQLPVKEGFYRAVRQEPVHFGEIGGQSQITYVHWYECGTTIPGRW